jgi:phosphohistidine phosphatase
MARHLSSGDEHLDVIYSSTATRALDFAQMISEFTGFTLIPDLTFYTFDTDELLEILRNLPDQAKRVAIVAHNPAITQLANRLSGSEISNVPTAGIVALNCAIEQWQQLGATAQSSELDYFESPKILNLR